MESEEDSPPDLLQMEVLNHPEIRRFEYESANHQQWSQQALSQPF
jgi:hypothetical protein